MKTTIPLLKKPNNAFQITFYCMYCNFRQTAYLIIDVQYTKLKTTNKINRNNQMFVCVCVCVCVCEALKVIALQIIQCTIQLSYTTIIIIIIIKTIHLLLSFVGLFSPLNSSSNLGDKRSLAGDPTNDLTSLLGELIVQDFGRPVEGRLIISSELRLPVGGEPPLTVARRCLAGSSGS